MDYFVWVAVGSGSVQSKMTSCTPPCSCVGLMPMGLVRQIVRCCPFLCLTQYCLTRLMAPGSVVHKRRSCKIIACSQKWLKDYFLFTNVAVRLLLVHNSIFKIIHSEIFCVAKDEAQERQLWYWLFTKVTARILFEKVAARLLHKSSCKIVGCLQK